MAADGSIIIKILGDDTGFSDVLRGLTSVAKNALDSVVAVGSQFSSSMSQVAATMGLTVQEVNSGTGAYQMLKEAAKEAGATTAFSASQAADALNYLALAGYDAEQAADALPAVLNLAAAGGLDLAYASDLATDAMSALGIEASNKNLTQFGDQMAKTASKANTSVGQLGEAILTVGGTAKSLAGGTVELNAALGVLANRGIKGAEGGTALRNVILSLSAPTDKAKAALDKFGIAVYDNAGNMRSLNDIFQDLNGALGSLTEGEKTQVLNEIFNKVDLKSAQALLAGTGEEFENLASAIEASGGAMQNMADVQLNNLEGDMQMLNSATEGLAINIYDALEPALRGLTQAFTAVVSFVSDIAEDAPWLVTMIAGAAVAVGALVAAITVYNVVTKIAAALSLAFGTATNIALGPVALLIAAIGAMIGLVSGLNQAYKDAHAETYAMIDAADALTESLNNQRDAFIEATNAINGERDSTASAIGVLDELISKEGQTAADRQVILSLVDQLNESIPGLALAYDEETNSLNMTSDALNRMADAYYGEQLAAEGAAYQKELVLGLDAKEKELKGLLAEAEIERANAAQQGAQYMTRAEEDVQKRIQKTKDEIADLNAQIAVMNGGAVAVEAGLKALGLAVDDVTESLGENIDEMAASGAAIEEMQSYINDLAEDYNEAYEAARESVEGQFGLWEKLDEVTATSVADMNAAIESQIKYWNDYNDNLLYLNDRAKDIEGLELVIAQFSDGSQESIAAVKGISEALANGQEEDVKEMVTNYLDLKKSQNEVEENMAETATGYKEELKKLEEYTAQTMDDVAESMDIADEAYTAGQNNVQGLINGTNSKSGQLMSTYVNIAKNALNAVTSTFDVHSPSRAMFDIGVNNLLGLINGSKSKEKNLIDTYTEMAEKVQDELDDYLNDSEHQIFLWGLQDGNEQQIIAQYRDMMNQLHTMADTYRAMGLDENSEEIQKLQKQWVGYSEDIVKVQEKMISAIGDALDDFTKDSEHQIFLLENQGGDVDQIIAVHKSMMDQIHATAEKYREMGLAENSEEIQDLQKQWYDHYNEIQSIQESQYQKRLKELQKALDREEITQVEYLQGLVAAQKEYLREGTDAWESAMEDQEAAIQSQVDVINGLEDDYEKALGNVKSVLSEYIKGVESDYESALRDLQNAQDNMQSKLAGVGDLFSIEKNTKTGKETFSITNLKESIDSINAYGDALEGLKERGISESLMQEVLGMKTEDATRYADKLLKMTDDQFDNYLSLWEEKQTAAASIAEKFYSDDLKQIQDDYADEMTSIIAELPEEFRPLGEEAMQELSYGLQEKGEEAVATVRDIKEQIQAELATITEMFQNAVFNEVSSFSSKLEFKSNAAAESESIKASKQAAEIANNMAMATSATTDSKEIVMKINETEIGRAILPSIRAAEDQSPRIVSD